MQTAMYKGKKYRVEFIGETKFGRRAKLSFMDGSKQFWVPAAEVNGVKEGDDAASAAKRAGVRGGMYRCPECGG